MEGLGGGSAVVSAVVFAEASVAALLVVNAHLIKMSMPIIADQISR